MEPQGSKPADSSVSVNPFRGIYGAYDTLIPASGMYRNSGELMPLAGQDASKYMLVRVNVNQKRLPCDAQSRQRAIAQLMQKGKPLKTSPDFERNYRRLT